MDFTRNGRLDAQLASRFELRRPVMNSLRLQVPRDLFHRRSSWATAPSGIQLFRCSDGGSSSRTYRALMSWSDSAKVWTTAQATGIRMIPQRARIFQFGCCADMGSFAQRKKSRTHAVVRGVSSAFRNETCPFDFFEINGALRSAMPCSKRATALPV